MSYGLSCCCTAPAHPPAALSWALLAAMSGPAIPAGIASPAGSQGTSQPLWQAWGDCDLSYASPVCSGREPASVLRLGDLGELYPVG